MVGRAVTLGRELPGSAVDLHVGEVDERPQPGGGPSRIGQLGVIGNGQVGADQYLHR